MTNRTYKHMLDRMNKDLISLTLTINAYSDSLRSKNTIYGIESAKEMQTRQEKLQSRKKLQDLIEIIDHEQEKRRERIVSLQNSIQNKQDALQKRIKRQDRQIEIAE